MNVIPPLSIYFECLLRLRNLEESEFVPNSTVFCREWSFLRLAAAKCLSNSLKMQITGGTPAIIMPPMRHNQSGMVMAFEWIWSKRLQHGNGRDNMRCFLASRSDEEIGEIVSFSAPRSTFLSSLKQNELEREILKSDQNYVMRVPHNESW